MGINSKGAKKAWATRRKNKAKLNPKKKTAFDNYHGIGKNDARLKLLHYINHSRINSGKFICLPSDRAIFEQALNLMYPNTFDYVAAECDSEKYLGLCKTKKSFNLNMTIHKGFLSDVIAEMKKDECSHAFYDYCKIFKSHKWEIIHTIVNDIIGVGGIFAFTVATRVNGNLKPSTIEGKTKTLSEIEETLSLYMDKNYKIIDTLGYRDSMGMLLVIIKRIK